MLRDIDAAFRSVKKLQRWPPGRFERFMISSDIEWQFARSDIFRRGFFIYVRGLEKKIGSGIVFNASGHLLSTIPPK